MTETAIYVCEDEGELFRAIAGALSDRYPVVQSETGAEAMAAARESRALLLVMDRKLKNADGLELLRQLRAEGNDTPVLMMSAMGAVNDRVDGLSAGGDDYLAKPFALSELRARVDALVRRLAKTPSSRLVAGPLAMDRIARKVWRGTREIQLAPREFQLLEFFMLRPGQLVTRKMLLEGVWNYRFSTNTNVVDVHIRNLRLKLGEPSETRLIVNQRGEGFILDAHA